ncbi:serine/threonine protein kinase [Oculatella sp. LEGE 06141]|nr:serine/threonine protein kinase [Oculatella sp. LEGE 06141]
MIGTVLYNRYQVQRQLGKRAGRRSLLALDLETQNLVVVKLLTFGNDFEWDDLKLFEREAETLQALSHPAIPNYLNHFELDLPHHKGFALVQTYIDANSLEEQLKAGRTFSEADIKELATSLLEILLYLHGRQPPVIHRDIKPSNILLTNRSGNSVGQVYLVDFGSVQTLAAKEGGTLTVVGTYGYMPPEQFGGRAVPASDLYSLGATLIYLATGRHPADLPQLDLQIEFESIVQLRPDLVRWLKQMTHPSLNRRFGSAQEALHALQHGSAIAPQPGYSTFLARKPADTKVQLTRDDQTLEILVPPPGFSAEVGGTILFAIAWNAFLVVWTGGALQGSLFFALFSLPFWGVGITMILKVLRALVVHTRLQIDRETVSLSYELLGWPFKATRPMNVQNVGKLVHTRRSSRWISTRHGSREVEIKPRIVIWVGTRKYEIGETLTDPELDWLSQELSQWLQLPVVRE